jgi:hypothetical protein
VALLIVQRSAPVVLASASASAPSRWQGKLPVCLLAMSGKKKELTLKLGANFKIGGSLKAEASVQAPAVDDPISVALALDASAELQANAQIKGVLMHLSDPNPGWYLRGNDVGLKADFGLLLGLGNNKKLKEEVLNWYAYVLDMTAQLLSVEKEGNPVQASALKTVEEELKTLNGGLGVEDTFKTLAADTATDEIKGFLEETIQNEPTVSALQQMIDIARGKWEKATTADVIADLQKLQALFATYARHSAAARVYQQQINAQIAWYTQNLQATKAAKDSAQGLVLPPKSGSKPNLSKAHKRLSYLSVCSFIPSASGKASATLSADGSLSGGPAGANAKAQASAGVSAEGQVGFTSYRYQSFVPADGGIPLVYTQDNQLSYRQAQISAEALANLDASGEITDFDLSKGFSKEVGAGKEAVYNLLTYQSVQAYWQYGAGLSGGTGANTNSNTVELEKGSGLSFGCSVSFLKLVRIARQVAGTDPIVPKDQTTLANLARQLRVKLADLKAFLVAAAMEDLAKSDLAVYTSVILEANHAFTLDAAPTLPLKKRTNAFFSKNKEVQYDLQDLLQQPTVTEALDALTNNPEAPAVTKLAPKLASIRLRARLADHVANDKTLFQLGFKVVAGLSVKLDKIQSAGRESVLDVYAHWFGDFANYNNKEAAAANAYELGVPAVTLLHQ